MDLQNEVERIHEEFNRAISSVDQKDDLESIRVQYLGKKGRLTAVLRQMGKISPKDRAEIGGMVNRVKSEMNLRIETETKRLRRKRFEKLATSEWIDITADEPVFCEPYPPAAIHPISQIQREIEEIFLSMGFEVLDGPEVENEYYNFTALNTPEDHPARDMQDTFWTEDGNLLRTHTSAIQVRGMERRKPPFRVIGPGRVFRYETIDASHENTFYQVEGMMVDKDISVAHLIYTMKSFLSCVFSSDVRIRLRPGYFPFVEPGFELDIHCLICSGAGCAVCKRSGWLELLPCGLVHPNVLRSGNIDHEKYSGFAFGLGLNRLVMMRYGINDIRWFQSGDLRFLSQFS